MTVSVAHYAKARRLVTIEMAMGLLGVKRRTVYEWMERGKVEWVKTAGGHRRIYLDTLMKAGQS